MKNIIKNLALILYGIADMTFIVFFALKVTATVNWSWIIITLPLWGAIGLTILFGITVFFIWFVFEELF